MKKEIVDSNIFFNYAVKVLIQDCILPELNLQENDEPIEFIISIDNRNIRVGELNNLETYLKTEFCIYDDDFNITYYDSKTNYGIQLADLIVNTFYNSYYKFLEFYHLTQKNCIKHIYEKEEIKKILIRFKKNSTFLCAFLVACYTGMSTVKYLH